jgi:hypothetical protein
MHYDILFRTSRFNLSKPQPYFINECCFGDDLAKWLVSKLPEVGVPSDEPYQEDWGWEFSAKLGTNGYYVGVGGLSDDDPANPNHGEFRIMVTKRRTPWEVLFGRNKLRQEEAILGAVETLLSRDPGFTDLRRE